jgi:hypothetical protein
MGLEVFMASKITVKCFGFLPTFRKDLLCPTSGRVKQEEADYLETVPIISRKSLM